MALVSLYNATAGTSWTNTWDLNQPMNTWYGVTLDGNGYTPIIRELYNKTRQNKS